MTFATKSDIALKVIASYTTKSYAHKMTSSLISQAGLAKKLRLSSATVSLALAGNPRIAAATRTRVQAFAHKMGYKVNRSAALLANQRWAREVTLSRPNIAYMQTLRSEGAKDLYLPGLQKQAEALGYHLDIFHSWEFPSKTHLAKVLYSRGIQGVIVAESTANFQPYIPPLDQFAVVQCGFFWPVKIYTLVRPDLDVAVRLCFEKARSRRFRRVGMILLKDPKAESDRILENSIWNLKRLYPDNVEVFIEKWSMYNTQPELLKDWFHRKKIDAVVGITAVIAELLHKMDIKVPFASMIYDPSRPQFAGADIQCSIMGEMSISLLDSYLRQNLRGIPTVKKVFMVEPIWREGTSLSRRRLFPH